MGVLSKLENGLDSAMDKAAGAVFRGPIEPAQIAKRAEKQMAKEKLVGAGKQYAPTLYTVLVNQNDDRKLFAFYPTIAKEIENYLLVKGADAGLKFDGRPLLRFIVDKTLKSGKFDVVAENVAAPIVDKLRDEELEYYGIKTSGKPRSVQAQEWDASEDSFDDPFGEPAPRAYAGDRQSIRNLRPARAPLNAPPVLHSNPIDGLDRVSGVGAVGAGFVGANAIANVAANAAGGGMAIGAAGAAGMIDVAGMPGAVQDVGSTGTALTKSGSVIGQARLFNINAGMSFELNKNPLIIGRDQSCDLTVVDANVSRRHAQMTQDVVGTWKISDLGSTNGTKLNGNKITMALLRDGDQLAFGITVLEFRES